MNPRPSDLHPPKAPPEPSTSSHAAEDETDARRLLIESRKLQQAAESLLEMQSFDHVLEIVCVEAEKLTGATGSAILLAEKGAIPRRSFRHGRALPQPDDAVVRSDEIFHRLPLSVRGHDLGTLMLIGERDDFDEVGLGLVRRFADQAAVAIQHALLHLQHEKLVILEERQKLAHELHDSVTQSIYGVTMYSEAAARLLESNQPEKASAVLHELQKTALAALREMRLLVFELRPPMLAKEGLAAALQARLAAVEDRAGLVTELSVDHAEPLPPRIAEALYGIAKEALNNVLKHSGAARVVIRLQRHGSTVVLEISDDGAGFEPALASSKGGLGLQGMQERAAGVEGELRVTSRPGGGTRVLAQIPLPDPFNGGASREIRDE